ncbi:MAG: hypothetical protein P4L73_13315 [Caulobacteraceae bacterium]|nr:hypothetical protein [Caulobacteraceae bacterium]
MMKLISAVLGSVMVLAIVGAGPAVWWYDRRPPGVPSFQVRAPGFLGHFVHFTLGLPESLAARGADDKATFATEQGAFLKLRAAFAVENDAVVNLQATSARWRAASANAEARAVRSNAWRLDLATRLQSTPAPADTSEIALCRAADAILKEGGQ